MAIAIASISTYVYKYVFHRIAISYVARDAISPKIMEKRHRLLCRWTLYLYFIYCVLLYLQSTCMNKMRVRFTILFHLKTMTATTFNTYQVWECLLGLPPSFYHKTSNHLLYNPKLAILRKLCSCCVTSSILWCFGQLLSCQNLFARWRSTCWKQAIKMLLASSWECLIEVGFDIEHAFTNKNTWNKTSLLQGRWLAEGGGYTLWRI